MVFNQGPVATNSLGGETLIMLTVEGTIEMALFHPRRHIAV
jgi:hypothetical protein